MLYTDVNSDILKIGRCHHNNVRVRFVVPVLKLEFKLWNNIDNNNKGDFSRLGPLLLGRLQLLSVYYRTKSRLH
jgi:hypothetical protein